MSSTMLPRNLVRRVAGFGGAQWADGFVFNPRSVEEVQQTIQFAKDTGHKVALRGAGRSYGDAATIAEEIVLDLTALNGLELNAETGVATVEAGATIGDLWRAGIVHGWWPPVVSGTQFPTIGGALAMNIHGKNAWSTGTLGEHVLSIDVAFASGETTRLTPDDDRFRAVISGAGLFGIILAATIQMKRVVSGDLVVTPVSCRNWDEQFAAFDEFRESDYRVSWIDGFGSGASTGRGQFHAARYVHDPEPDSLLPENQDLPDRILGVVPKSQVWRALKLLNNRHFMRGVNLAKHFAGKFVGNRRPHRQGLVAFSFLLDYVPGWERAYSPGGFIQYQSFVPAERARDVFDAQIKLQQAAKLENFLAVMKRHRTDDFLLSHGVDGFSLAQDFKVTSRNRNKLWRLCHEMNEIVLDAGGKFYLAKDSTLRPEDVAHWLGKDQFERFRAMKAALDPDRLFETEMSRRLHL